MNNNLIKTIRIKNENGEISETPLKIGTSVDCVEYSAENSLQDILGNELSSEFPIDMQLITLHNNINTIENTIQQIQNNIKEITIAKNRINTLSQQIENISDNISVIVNEKFNNTKLLTNDIVWEDGSAYTLRNILGNLLNMPKNIKTLRDWLEKIDNNNLSEALQVVKITQSEYDALQNPNNNVIYLIVNEQLEEQQE